MERKFTKDARTKILHDTTLYAELCEILKVKAGSLSQLLYKNSARVLNHDAVLKVANAMGKTPDEILEEKEVVVA